MRRIAILALAILSCAFGLAAQAPNTIKTIAGGGTNPAIAKNAYFPEPRSAVKDSAGNAYISVPVLNIVYKVDTSGTLTIYAGNGINGFSGDGGAAAQAEMGFPQGVALDTNGNLFIADSFNNRIRRVDAQTHVITTVAGSEDPFFGGYAGDGGAATEARLNTPFAVAVDKNFNLFIADTDNNVIRRVDAITQIITTYAGNGNQGTATQANGDGGAATSARLNQPGGVAVDLNGNVFIADTQDQVIRKVNTSAPPVISTYAGNGNIGAPGQANGDGGLATAAQIDQPGGVAVDAAGNVYLTDSGNPRIREVDLATLHINTLVGTGTICVNPTTGCGDGGSALNANLNFPVGVFVDASGILITDSEDMRVRFVAVGTNPIIANFAGGGSVGDGGLATSVLLGTPQILTLDGSGNIFTVETNGERLRRIDASTDTITTYAGDGIGGGTIGTNNGDGGPATSAAFVSPIAVATDSAGNFYVADKVGEVIRKINTSAPPGITTVAGNGLKCGAAGNPNTQPACGDGGPATSASLVDPTGVAVDSQGNIFYVDAALNTVRRIAVDGTISTFAGTPGTPCSSTTAACGDGGTASLAQLNAPIGVAFDAQDNLYIADAGDNRIRKVDTTGNLTINTVAFTGEPSFGGDGGPALEAVMEFPDEVALDNKGNLFIGGGADNVVRRVDATDQSIITVAGDVNNLNGGFSGDGGPSVGAMIANFGLAIDSSHNLYIGDSGSNRIRKVNLAPVTVESGTFTAFGPTIAGQTDSMSQQVLFENNGLDDLILTVTSSGSSAFQLGVNCVPTGAQTCVITIPPQETGDIQVDFAPPAGVAGALTGNLAVTTNDTANPTFNFALTGGEAPPVTLNVTINPAAAGNVFSDAVGGQNSIQCPSTCSASFATGSVVTLTAFPSTGFAFTGWNTGNAPGASCPGTTSTCSVTMSLSQTVGANFTAMAPGSFMLSVTNPNPGNGTGAVVSVPAGISCPPTCSFDFPASTTSVVLTATATAANGSKFAGWLGDTCSSSGVGPCTVFAFPGTEATTAVFSGPAQAFVKGQIFLSTDDAMVFVYNPAGTVAQVLPSSSLAGQGAGMTFDSVGNLYLTNRSVSAVQTFTNHGAGPVTFASNLSGPLSDFVDPTGNVFVGEADGIGEEPLILQFAPGSGGTPNTTFFPAYDGTFSPTAWIELLDNNDTVAYTLGGKTLKIFNLSDQDQHADLITTLHGAAALRELSDKTILVADSDRIVRVGTTGTIAQTYTIPATGALFDNLNLDPDGVTFWTNDELTGTVYRINIQSGAVVSSFPTSLGITSTVFTQGIGGVAVFGQPLSGGADVSVTMTAAPSPVTQGANLTYTVTVTNNGPLAANAVTVTDALPTGATFVSANPSVGTCSGTTTVTCALGNMNSAATATITLVITATQTGALANTVNVTSTTADPDALNNSATTSTTVNSAASVTLHVTLPGTALGTVTDNLGQINCSQSGGANPTGTCSAQYSAGTQVILTESTPGTFAGWSGAPTACTVAGSTCTLTVSAAETVSATFNSGPGTFPLTISAGSPHTGAGTITSVPTGINCTLVSTATSGTCISNFPAGAVVTLTSAASAGSAFFGWSGTTPFCLSSSSVSCVVGMSAAEAVDAEFTSGGGTVNVTVTGPGNVTDTANSATINCTNTAAGPQSGTCTSGYALGTVVTLTETPAAGASFTTWTGASCSNPTATTCSFTVSSASAPIAVSATFAASSGGGLSFTSTTLPAGAVTVPYGADIQITGGTPPYTVNLANGSTLPAGFTLDSTAVGNAAPGHVVNDAPGAAGTFTFGVNVTDSTSPAPLTGNATISLTIAATPPNTQPGLLKGQYAILLRGFNEVTGAEEAIVGSLTFDGAGTIGPGIVDVNSTTTIGVTQSIPTTGVYSIGPDNRGVMTITPSGQAPGVFAFSVGSVLNGVASTAYITSFTDDSGTGDIYSGTLRLQDPTSFNNAAFAGTYVYSSTGQDPQGHRVAEVGLTTVNNANAVTSGSDDANDDGFAGSTASITGSYTTPDGNGRSKLSLTLDTSPSTVVVYQISANEVIHMTLDSRTNDLLLVGTAERQVNPNTFSNTSLAGPDIFSLAGISGTQGTSALIGLLTATPSPTPTANLTTDSNEGGVVQIGQALSGALAITANGRGTITRTTGTLVFYLTQPDSGFMMTTDATVSSGPIVPQVGAPLSTTPFTNNNLFLGQQEAVKDQSSEFSGIITLGAANGLTATDDESANGGDLFFDQALGVFTYTVTPTGHFTLTSTTQGTSSGYVVSPFETVFLDNTGPTSDPGPSTHPHVTVAQSIPGQQPAVSVTFAPTSLAFNPQAVGTTSAAQNVTLTNSSTATLFIDGIAVTGTNLTEFTQINTCSASLAAGANCVITVTFTPAAAGGRSAAITVTDNATGSPQSVPLTGTGTTAAGTPALSITKSHAGNFGQGEQAATYTVTVSNGANAGPTTGVPVTVTETAPSGLTLVTMTGTGWTCTANTCTRTDVLANGASYPAITVTVNVAANATSPQVNAVAVSGGGSAAASTTDSTVITPAQTVPAPVPLVNQPLVPDATAPGGATFTLTVNGTGFVSGATVDWNGSARTTNFVNSHQLTATITAADIAAAKTASVTVLNPGSATSNVAFFTVTAPAASASFSPATGSPITVGNGPFAIAVGDFKGNGIQDLAVADDAGNSVTILLGNGDGTFTAAATPPGTFTGPTAILVADFNGDGKLDVAVLNGGSNSVTILLGNGDGTFFVPDFTTPTTGSNPLSFAAGDFNGDGHVDLAVANYRSNNVTILLGNGDGSFTATEATPATGSFPAAIVAGDFNKDGKLDLAVDNQCGTGDCSAGTVTILLGDGTGNFTPAAASPTTGSGPISMAVADFNGDGNLDLAVPSDCGSSGTCTTNGAVTVLLGDGTGNFTASTSAAATGLRPYGIVVGDFNGDGKPDLAIANNDSNTVSVLLGDGTGKFTPIATPLTTGTSPVFPAVGDFNNDGRLDIVVPNSGSDTISVFLAAGGPTLPAITITPTSLTFTSQNLNTTSAAQTVTVSNNSGSAVTFTNITTSGDFAGATLTQCPSLPSGQTPCTFQITFTPTAAGTRTGAITFTDNATGSPQMVTLTGTGTTTAGTVTLTPTSLTFASQALNTTSPPQTVTVSNTGNVPVGLTGFGITGPFAIATGANAGTCNSETDLNVEASCTVNITFTPTAGGTSTGGLSVSDNATGSPQTVALSGTSGQGAVTITIPPGGSTTASTTPGGTAFYGLMISGAPGVTGTVQLGCIPSSNLITCQVIPSSVVLNGGTTQIAFGIQTFCQGATNTGATLPFNFGGKFGWPIVILAFAGMLWTLQRNRRLAVTFATVLLIALGSAACASLPKGPNGATPAGTYSLTLTTTINGQTQTLQNFLTLVVK